MIYCIFLRIADFRVWNKKEGDMDEVILLPVRTVQKERLP
jgi:hypothetical protein